MAENSRGAMFRVIVPNQHSRVTYAELFFDLVFVYAVTQISHTLLGRFHAARRGPGHAAVPRGLVGVGLHLLDHQLAQSRTDAGPDPAVRADARRPRAVDLDPDGVRRPRPLVCDRLCGDAGRPDPVLAVLDAAGADAGAAQCHPHSGLAVGVGDVLDAGGFARGTVAAMAVGRGADDRIYLAGGAVLDTRNWGRRRSRTGPSKAATWPSVAPASSSSHSANPSSSPARRLPT